jgi:hypothetical protein
MTRSQKHAIAQIAVLASVALFVVVAIAAASSTASKGSRISITASVVDVRGQQPGTLGSRRVAYLLLFAKSGGIPIGHAFVSCVFVGSSGVLGGGVSTCGGTYRMPRGYLTTAGVRHSPDRYTLAVTGGTGLYAGAGGTLITTRLPNGDLRLQFLLV